MALSLNGAVLVAYNDQSGVFTPCRGGQDRAELGLGGWVMVLVFFEIFGHILEPLLATQRERETGREILWADRLPELPLERTGLVSR